MKANYVQSIAVQDGALPDCPRGKCSVCRGSELKHHWMFDFYENEDDENDPRNGEPRLSCRHCDAVIENFEMDDPDCPEI